MSFIQIENLTFSYPSGFENVFENLNLRLDTEWKLGFIGRNGKGKTTFLKLLMNEYEYSGKIISSVKFGYFPYAVRDESCTAIELLGKICPVAEEWEFFRETSYLELAPAALYSPFNTLSGGERTKVLLAGMFLNEGSFFLLDEPTNHLDAAARKIVSAYLNRKNGYILVSHDRKFLDGCVDHILSLNRNTIELQSGNFSSWYENFGRRQKFEQTQNERLKEEITRLQQSARKSADWAERTEKSKYGKDASGLKPDKGFVGHKAAKMMKRAKTTEERKRRAIEEKSELLKDAESVENLKISPLRYHAERLVNVSNLSVNYGGGEIFSPLSFNILRGERIALTGGNGCGKSSFLKLIAGQNIAYNGILNMNSKLKISYLPQDVSHIRGSLSAIAKESGVDESLFKAVLNKMDFEKSLFTRDVSEFSEGQKKKVLIAKSLCERAHLYIWDEPMNFIDIYSRMQIEDLIKEFQPTIIFAEHDLAFRETVATKIIELKKL